VRVFEAVGDTQEQLNQRLVLLDALTKSPAWSYFASMLERSEMEAYHASIAASDAHNMALSVGTLRAVKNIRSWPEREAILIRERLRQMAEEAAMLRDG
jgi:hypothetical protein